MAVTLDGHWEEMQDYGDCLEVVDAPGCSLVGSLQGVEAEVEEFQSWAGAVDVGFVGMMGLGFGQDSGLDVHFPEYLFDFLEYVLHPDDGPCAQELDEALDHDQDGAAHVWELVQLEPLNEIKSVPVTKIFFNT